MYDINRGKLCTLKTLLEGNSQIDPADAAAVLGEVLTDEDFEDDPVPDWNEDDTDDNGNDNGEDK
ncbi:MAG: hypothetical protein J6Y54_06085 [Lentisphaeria bacterium]|nr:hypothetical protein [Lentisphaeria bacterium]